jgi:hypothetical protein
VRCLFVVEVGSNLLCRVLTRSKTGLRPRGGQGDAVPVMPRGVVVVVVVISVDVVVGSKTVAA